MQLDMRHARREVVTRHLCHYLHDECNTVQVTVRVQVAWDPGGSGTLSTSSAQAAWMPRPGPASGPVPGPSVAQAALDKRCRGATETALKSAVVLVASLTRQTLGKVPPGSHARLLRVSLHEVDSDLQEEGPAPHNARSSERRPLHRVAPVRGAVAERAHRVRMRRAGHVAVPISAEGVSPVDILRALEAVGRGDLSESDVRRAVLARLRVLGRQPEFLGSS